MALGSLLIDVGVKLIVAFIFVVINTLVLKEVIVRLFKLEDKKLITAVFVSLWLSILFFIFSFFSITTLANILSVIITYLLFVFLVRIYYKTDWKKSVLIWLVWFVIYIILGALIVLIYVFI